MEKDAQDKIDWKRFGVMQGRDKKEPLLPDDEFLKREDLRLPKKQTITIRLDADVLDWFKRQGRGYQTRINKLLRSYMQAHRDQG